MKFLDSNSQAICSSKFKKIVALDRNYFPFPWTERKWDGLTDFNYFHLFYDDEVGCFALFQLFSEDRYAHLLKIIVGPELRRGGVASHLLGYCCDRLLAMGLGRCVLEVEEGNEAANALYIKDGFKLIHKQKSFYSNGATAHIMEKSFI